MKILWISLKITLAMCIVLGVGYVLVLRGISAVAGPNGGEADVVTLDGQVVGAANVGQRFTDVRYFWSRPCCILRTKVSSYTSRSIYCFCCNDGSSCCICFSSSNSINTYSSSCSILIQPNVVNAIYLIASEA